MVVEVKEVNITAWAVLQLGLLPHVKKFDSALEALDTGGIEIEVLVGVLECCLQASRK